VPSVNFKISELVYSPRDICALLSTATVERMLLLVHFIQLGWKKKDKKSLINNLLSWFSCRSSTLVQGIYIGTWRCSIFVEGVRSEYPEKGLWAGRGPIARSTHIWCWAGIEPWRHLWEAIALTTAPSSLPVVSINNGCPVNFSHGMMTLCVLE